MTTSFIVGAYAALPAELDQQPEFYTALAQAGFTTGLEIPYPGQLADATTRNFLGAQLQDRFTDSIVTLIPGTMQNVWANPNYGLASPDAAGRKAALEFTASAREAILQLNNDYGAPITRMSIHSAPTGIRNPQAFAASLEEITSWDWEGIQLIIEHCDAWTPAHQPEKGFLTLAEEITMAQAFNLGIQLNWGRSAVEEHSSGTPMDHILQANAGKVLSGIIFSGAGPTATQYGYPWIDGHLPLKTDEPGSLMTDQLVKTAVTVAGKLDYLGAKCCVPQDASIAKRIAMITNIYEATR